MKPHEILSLYFAGGSRAEDAIAEYNAYTGGSRGERWLSYNVQERSPELASPPEIWSGPDLQIQPVTEEREGGVSGLALQQARQARLARQVAEEEREGGVSGLAQKQARQQAQQVAQQQAQQARLARYLAWEARDESGGQFNLPPTDPSLPWPDAEDTGRMWEQGVDPDSQITSEQKLALEYDQAIRRQKALDDEEWRRAIEITTGQEPGTLPSGTGLPITDVEGGLPDIPYGAGLHLAQQAAEEEGKAVSYDYGSPTGFINEEIAKNRYMRSISERVRSRELTPFQGRYEREKFGDLYDRFELFEGPSEPSDEYGTFLNWLDTDSRTAMETRQRGRQLAEFLGRPRRDPSEIPYSTGSTTQAQDLLDLTHFGGDFEESGQNQQNAVMTAALAGVHPLYRAGVRRSLLALFEELGGSEAALNEAGNLPFLTAAYDQGYFGKFQ